METLATLQRQFVDTTDVPNLGDYFRIKLWSVCIHELWRAFYGNSYIFHKNSDLGSPESDGPGHSILRCR